MNRPFWLDFVAIIALFLPPVAAGAAATYGIARRAGVSGLPLHVVYLASIAIALGLWTVILVVGSKLTRPRRGPGLKGDDAKSA